MQEKVLGRTRRGDLWYIIMGGMGIFLKLVLTPLLIAVATLTARRYGPAVGGWLAGLPLVSGPVSVFLALEQGPDFAGVAARTGLLGLTAVAGFCVAYVFAARKVGWLIATLFGLGAYALCALSVAHLIVGPVTAFFLAFAAILAARVITGQPGSDSPHPTARRWDLPFRMASAAAMVLAITGSALLLGARWSGLLSLFPIFASVMAVFSHRENGPAAAHHLLSGVIVGSLSSASFLLSVGLMIRQHSLPCTYGIATCIALAVNWISLPALIARPRT